MAFFMEEKAGEFEDYYSAEFHLDQSKLLYQFKIRKSMSEPMFAVVKEGSRALEAIKEGDVIPMRYYSPDKSVPTDFRNTRIKYIAKDNTSGFKDHYMIGLDMVPEKEPVVA